MQDLVVALIQSDLHWHQPDANLAMFEEKIWSLETKPDVIILPEMFTTGFTMAAKELAEPMGTRTFKWLQQQAAHTGAAVAGSYIVKEGGHFYNRLLWVTPEGDYSVYDKRHLFRMAQEDRTYTSGTERLVVTWKGWRICPQICYDLRFPVWSRNRVNQGVLEFDLLIFVANWPMPRISAWDVLLRARAIENTCYSIGVNRVGEDGLEVKYNGHSAVVDPKGNVMYFEEGREAIQTVTLSSRSMLELREKFPVHLDADTFKIL